MKPRSPARELRMQLLAAHTRPRKAAQTISEAPAVAAPKTEAERVELLAREFGLTYLSREGYEKLARLINHVRSGQPLPH